MRVKPGTRNTAALMNKWDELKPTQQTQMKLKLIIIRTTAKRTEVFIPGRIGFRIYAAGTSAIDAARDECRLNGWRGKLVTVDLPGDIAARYGEHTAYVID